MLCDVLFKKVMSDYPSGVTIVTTADQDGKWRGFTASSFCSLSITPPLVLVCLAKSAECHDAFVSAQHWNIHFVDNRHTEVARRFARRGENKFSEYPFEADLNGIPLLADAASILRCSRHCVVEGGDHSILIARVDAIATGVGTPVYYVRGAFHDTAQLQEIER